MEPTTVFFFCATLLWVHNIELYEANEELYENVGVRKTYLKHLYEFLSRLQKQYVSDLPEENLNWEKAKNFFFVHRSWLVKMSHRLRHLLDICILLTKQYPDNEDYKRDTIIIRGQIQIIVKYLRMVPENLKPWSGLGEVIYTDGNDLFEIFKNSIGSTLDFYRDENILPQDI